MGNFIGNLLKDENIIVNGDGTPRRSYLYAADLVIWVFTILLKGESSRPYNVGSDNDVSISDLANRVKEISKKVQVEVLGKSADGTQVDRYVPSIGRAKSELHLGCLVDLDDALRRTFDFHLKNKG